MESSPRMEVVQRSVLVEWKSVIFFDMKKHKVELECPISSAYVHVVVFKVDAASIAMTDD